MVKPSDPAFTAMPEDAPQFATLDLGSNSFHLLTARFDKGTMLPLLRFKEKVQLAAGLKAPGILTEEAIERAVLALQGCAQRLQGFSPEQVRVVATHTLRIAQNSDILLNRAKAIFPFPIEIISGHEEARLIYHGVAQTTAMDSSRFIIDIGGGSTELAAGDKVYPKIVASVSMGCISYTEHFFAGGKLTRKRFDKSIIAARRELEAMQADFRPFASGKVYGTSGTIKALSGWCASRFNNAADTIELEQLYSLVDSLIEAKSISVIDINSPEFIGLETERAAIIPGGIAILIAVMEELGVSEVHAHDAALREGVLYQLAEQVLEDKDVQQRTIDSLALRYSVDTDQAARVQATALELLSAVKQEWQLKGKVFRRLLSWAALLHEIGFHINFSSRHKHAGYILQHTDMPGFNREEQQATALLARYFRKKIDPRAFPPFTLFETSKVLALLVLLRLAIVFNNDRQHLSPITNISVNGSALRISLTDVALADKVLMEDLEFEKRQFGKLGFSLYVVEKVPN
ncbi:exopolyphosphatase [Idiomarina sp. A28L]|uniref:Ppx/GppA phosphatase family protein n=1 Tax=Idiomarina sp. A28L TaxID=1036674 RepID=UPI0002138A33|nr:Ppx/GppA phosphatase family protein [Idiomarina sp. A28L]EGN75017.1 exopolyphosphatase [Idiomarina sp. A28L]